jgi:hypothetical protein
VPRLRYLLALACATAALIAAPSGASATIVTNGDFETGTLAGWQRDETPLGEWLVYTGTMVGEFPVPAPPQGTHAASTVQEEESRQILYQDVTLPPAAPSRLSLITYYRANAELVSPDTLSLGDPNEQYRIDVMRPSAPIDSVAPSDILLNVFRTLEGDPQDLLPTQRTADLSAFAGQTVRLRFAVAVTLGELNAGVDAVSVDTNEFTVGTAQRNKKKGTAIVPLTLPNPGDVTVSGNGVKGNVVASPATTAGPGLVNVVIKAKGKKKRKLNSTGKVKVQASIAFTPSGFSSKTQTLKLKLKKKLKK